MIALLLWTSGLALACDDVADAHGDLLRALDAAEAAWAASDPEPFQLHVDRTVIALACLSDVLPPTEAARLHRAWGLRMFGAAPERSAQSWAAARASDPSWTMSEELLPQGHPERLLWSEAPTEGGEQPLPKPNKGVEVYLDGVKASERPDWRTAVLQVSQQGTLTHGALLFPGDPLPSYPSTPVKENAGKRSAAPAVATMGSGLVAVGLWSASGVARARFNSDVGLDDPDSSVNLATLETRRVLHNRLWTSAVGATALTAISATWLTVAW